MSGNTGFRAIIEQQMMMPPSTSSSLFPTGQLGCDWPLPGGDILGGRSSPSVPLLAMPPPLLPSNDLLDPAEQRFFSEFLDFLVLEQQPGSPSSFNATENARLREPNTLPSSHSASSLADIAPVKSTSPPPLPLVVNLPCETKANGRGSKKRKKATASATTGPAAKRAAATAVSVPSALVPTPANGQESRSRSASFADAASQDSHNPSEHTNTLSSSDLALKRSNAKKELLTADEKRVNHVVSEQKRRNMIRNGFDALVDAVPRLKAVNQSHSKSNILFQSVEYIEQLKRDNAALQERMMWLERELVKTQSATLTPVSAVPPPLLSLQQPEQQQRVRQHSMPVYSGQAQPQQYPSSRTTTGLGIKEEQLQQAYTTAGFYPLIGTAPPLMPPGPPPPIPDFYRARSATVSPLPPALPNPQPSPSLNTPLVAPVPHRSQR